MECRVQTLVFRRPGRATLDLGQPVAGQEEPGDKERLRRWRAEAVAHEIFSMLDTDKSDVLSAEEMTKALTRLLAGVTDDEVANLVRMFDADNSGQVERDDFVEFVAKALEENA